MIRKKVQITLPEDLKTTVEKEAEKDFMSISKWIERSVLQYLEKNKKVQKDKVIDLDI